jgi:hypothetical protein
MDEAADRAGELRAEVPEQAADPGQSLVRQLAGGLIGESGDVEAAGDLARDLVGQGVLDGGEPSATEVLLVRAH